MSCSHGNPIGGCDTCDEVNAAFEAGKRSALTEQPAQQQELQTCNCRWEGEVQVQQCTLHEAHVDAIHEWAERAKSAENQFKNFHRLLCERFGYAHDERDWQRDQLSLIEWIAKRAEQPAQQEPVAWMNILEDGYKCLTHTPIPNWTPLYTSPPANANAGKPWVGLTDEETGHWVAGFLAGAKLAEAKLKEKNT